MLSNDNAKRVREQHDKHLEELADAHVAFITEIGRRVVLRTPVRSGWARGNWFVATQEDDTLTFTADKSGTATTNRIGKEAEGARDGSVLYLQNNVDYVPYLEYGTYKMQPVAMVRLTNAEAPSIWNRIVKEQVK